MQRKLAAILAADVVGYSRLMEADEADTLARLKSTRESLIDPKIAAHNGRIVKLMGDGALVEFASVVDAVGCAVNIQRAMAECNAELPRQRQLELRIGVNLGDIIVEGQDIYGDGVNVAARLEGLADPGGVMISGTAFDQVEKKLGYDFEFLGEQQVKNIAKPVRLYRVRLGAKSAPVPVPVSGKTRRNWHWPAAVVLALAIGGVALWSGTRDNPPPPAELASKASMELPLPGKPSIAVLPFTNMSGEAGQDYFADGMTDNLITDLSKVSGLFVIARNSTFVYRGQPVKIKQVAEDLGVRYVLEGSVQRAGERVRVNAQLIDALTGGHVWADRFDGNVTDIFAVQDEFIKKIVKALEINLTAGEKQEIANGKTESIAAKAAFDEGWSLYLRYTATDNAAAIVALKKAIQLDPEYGRAYAALSLAYFRIVDSGWFGESQQSWVQAWTTAENYMELANKHPTSLSHVVEALFAAGEGRTDDARKEAGRAIALDPNDPEAHIAMAVALTISGQPDEALDFVATAIRINPNYPSNYSLAHGIALLTANNLEEAARVFDDGLKRSPQASVLFMPLASTLARLGRRAEARQVLLKWRPEADQRQLENLAGLAYFVFKWDDAHRRVRERLFDGLRVASLPLDVTVPNLLVTLESGTPLDRITAVNRLGWFGPAAADAVPTLIEALKTTYVRKEAVQSLGKIGPAAQAAIPALLALQDESLIGSYAKEALKEIRAD